MARYALCLGLLLALAGCDDAGHTDIRQWMEEASRSMTGRVPPLPELKPFPAVSYDPAGSADPFDPSRLEPERKQGGGANKPDFDRPREQLESYPLESVRFVGFVNKTGARKKHAVVQVEGVLFQVGKGNYIGQNFGRVVDISDSEIVLKEIVQDPGGQSNDWVERQAVLQLQEGAKDREAKK